MKKTKKPLKRIRNKKEKERKENAGEGEREYMVRV